MPPFQVIKGAVRGQPAPELAPVQPGAQRESWRGCEEQLHLQAGSRSPRRPREAGALPFRPHCGGEVGVLCPVTTIANWHKPGSPNQQ